MRTFVMGDLHGAWRALKQCLQRASFDYAHDRLIQLGDVVDGRPEVYECVEELLTITHLVAIRGNHDEWFRRFLHTGIHPDQWQQRGRSTAVSYLQHAGRYAEVEKIAQGFPVNIIPGDIPPAHQQFFEQQQPYYIDSTNNCFVHAGFFRHQPFGQQPEEVYYWDRQLWLAAVSLRSTIRGLWKKTVFHMATPFKEIYIGHTPVTNWDEQGPMHAANIWNLDSGAGHAGRLTIMDIETKKYWQSDPVPELYGETPI